MSLCNTCRHQARSALARLHTKQPPIHHHRSLTSTPPHRENNTNTSFPTRDLGAFYNDLIAKPLPKSSKADSSTNLPDWIAAGGRKEIEDRAKKVFGSIEGSGYVSSNTAAPDSTWQTINGVPIPPRPREPDNCCMSGCVNCVWDDYRIDVEGWAGRVREAQAKGAGRGVRGAPKVNLPRPEVHVASTSMDDDGGGSESLWDTPSTVSASTSAGEVDGDQLFAEIPIGIREFMANEKRIRERKRARKMKKEGS